MLSAELAQESEEIHFREDVIAGLRERGWPEPREQQPNGEFITSCLVWGSETYPQVWLSQIGDCFGYEAADDQESGSGSFGDNTDAARAIEAIDRLRWVIGLPASQEEGALPKGMDPDGRLVAMTPSKPQPTPERPYEPTRWIGERNDS